MKFIVIVCAAFLARVNPVPTIANPACMNITRNPATNAHTKLIATVFAGAWTPPALAAQPARRPASAGRTKAAVYLAAIVFRRTRFAQLIVSTVGRVAPEVNV